MATTIKNYDGTDLTTVQDGTLDSTHASIKFPGRGYLNYGEPVNENMLWIMEHFAAASAPQYPIVGQIWYDTSIKLMKFYDGATWINVGGVISSVSPPTGHNNGDFWYDSANNQLYTYSVSLGTWLLVGPLGSSANADPQDPSIVTWSKIQAAQMKDSIGGYHSVWFVIVHGTLLGIISKDPTFIPFNTYTGFSTINPGLNFNSTVAGIGVSGDTTLFRNNQTNLPNTDATWDLGSNSYHFRNVYGISFYGTDFTASGSFHGVATSAQYADLAERYRADRVYPAGTLVKLGGTAEITVESNRGSNDVFGVISTNPAYLMNNTKTADELDLPVALVGRVPCRVIGNVRKGQRLMASGFEGAVCAWEESFGTLSIIGRSLVNKETAGIETVEIFIGKN